MSGGITIVNGRGVNVRVDGGEVTVSGERWVAVPCPRRLRVRVEAWARRHRLSLAAALAQLAEKGLDAEEDALDSLDAKEAEQRT